MKVHVIIDYEYGGAVEATAVEFDDQMKHEWKYIGDAVGRRISGYLRAKDEWNRKSEVEKILLETHDALKGYKGVAPAGKPEVAWCFNKINPATSRIVVPVNQKEMERRAFYAPQHPMASGAVLG